MGIKDPVIKRFIDKIKHPAVITFIILLSILILLGVILDYIRPYPTDMIGFC